MKSSEFLDLARIILPQDDKMKVVVIVFVLVTIVVLAVLLYKLILAVALSISAGLYLPGKPDLNIAPISLFSLPGISFSRGVRKRK